jgi:hypothetical protein
MVDEDVIYRIAELFGVGVSKLRKRNERWQQSYSVILRGRRAMRLMIQLYPMMSKRRQAQIRRALSSYDPEHHFRNRALTLAQAAEIRAALLRGIKVPTLTREYGVTCDILYSVQAGRSYKEPEAFAIAN